MGGRQAANAGAARRRRSKGGLMIAERVPSCDANLRGVTLRVSLDTWHPSPIFPLPEAPKVLSASAIQHQEPCSLENKSNL